MSDQPEDDPICGCKRPWSQHYDDELWCDFTYTRRFPTGKTEMQPPESFPFKKPGPNAPPPPESEPVGPEDFGGTDEESHLTSTAVKTAPEPEPEADPEPEIEGESDLRLYPWLPVLEVRTPDGILWAYSPNTRLWAEKPEF
jgi:hypothetical protein